MELELNPWPATLQHGPDEEIDWVGGALGQIVDRAADLLKPTPRRIIHVNPGRQVPWDPDKVCDGLVAGRVLTITPFTGSGGRTAHRCGVWEWIATCGIQIVRCVATVDDDGTTPSTREMDADGVQMTRDMANLQRAIMCDDRVRTFGAWNPLGPMGGVAGGEWTFTLRIPVCHC